MKILVFLREDDCGRVDYECRTRLRDFGFMITWAQQYPERIALLSLFSIDHSLNISITITILNGVIQPSRHVTSDQTRSHVEHHMSLSWSTHNLVAACQSCVRCSAGI